MGECNKMQQERRGEIVFIECPNGAERMYDHKRNRSVGVAVALCGELTIYLIHCCRLLDIH